MAKIFKVKKCKKTETGFRVTGVVGKNEKGDDLAHADYYGSGGLSHHPEENEVATLVSLESGRFHIILGNKSTVIDLEKGETAFFSVQDGIVQGYIKAQNDGELHLNGSSSSATLFDQLKTYLDTFQRTFNRHTHGTSQPGTPTTPPTSQFMNDVSNARSQKVKLS